MLFSPLFQIETTNKNIVITFRTEGNYFDLRSQSSDINRHHSFVFQAASVVFILQTCSAFYDSVKSSQTHDITSFQSFL